MIPVKVRADFQRALGVDKNLHLKIHSWRRLMFSYWISTIRNSHIHWMGVALG